MSDFIELLKSLESDSVTSTLLIKEYANRTSSSGLLEKTIKKDTKEYITSQKYLDDFELVVFGVLLPAIETVFRRTRNADNDKNKALINKEMERSYAYFERLCWDFVIAGYLVATISRSLPDARISRVEYTGIRRHNVESVAKEVNEEFGKRSLDARMFSYITQETMFFFLDLSSKVDDFVLKDNPALFRLIKQGQNNEKQYTIAADCMALLGLGVSLSLNDLLDE